MCDDVLSVSHLTVFLIVSEVLCLFQGSRPGPKPEQRVHDQQGPRLQDQNMPAPPGLQPTNKVCQGFQSPDTSKGSLSSDGEDDLRGPNAATKHPAAAGIFPFSPNLYVLIRFAYSRYLIGLFPILSLSSLYSISFPGQKPEARSQNDVLRPLDPDYR